MNDMMNSAKRLLIALEKIGGRAFIVGGAVRDIVMSVEPHDIDVATDLSIDAVSSHFRSHDVGRSKDFGIVVVEWEDFTFEVAQFRSDGEYTDGRTPGSITPALDFKTDASRRDFTINAMAMDASGNILDYFGGREDIAARVVRTVGDPSKRFREDKLRMLRAARFAAKLDFNIESKTRDAMLEHSKDIKQVSGERIRDELMKIAASGGRQLSTMLKELYDAGILSIILPEIAAMDGLPHNPAYHPEGDCLAHCFAALETSDSTDPIVNLAILFHDIGKVKTFKMDGDNPTYRCHAFVGTEMFEGIAFRLKLSTAEADRISFCIENHMLFNYEFPNMRDSTVARLLRDHRFSDLLLVAEADDKARLHVYDEKIWKAIRAKIEKVKQKLVVTDYDKLRKLINGNEVMRILKIKPGPLVGKVINSALNWAVDSDVSDPDAVYAYIRDTSLMNTDNSASYTKPN